jgi:putative addiction module CopG family antidote
MRCEEDAMPTQKVVLAKHQEKLIEILVGSGRYQNASEVLRDGLQLVEQREAEDAAKLEVLREAAGVGPPHWIGANSKSSKISGSCKFI